LGIELAAGMQACPYDFKRVFLREFRMRIDAECRGHCPVTVKKPSPHHHLDEEAWPPAPRPGVFYDLRQQSDAAPSRRCRRSTHACRRRNRFQAFILDVILGVTGLGAARCRFCRAGALKGRRRTGRSPLLRVDSNAFFAIFSYFACARSDASRFS